MVSAGMNYRLMNPPGARVHWFSGYFSPGLEVVDVRNSKEKTTLEIVCIVGKTSLVSKNTGMRVKP